MLLPLVLSCALAAAVAAPATFDERQDGEFNVRADVKNVMLLVAVPKMGQWLTPNLLNVMFSKSAGEPAREAELQERADVRVMEAFVEPSTPYRVEIGEGERTVEGDARAVEVVIAGRRRAGVEAQAQDGEEIKLLGATEQCGPDRERDPVTLTCRARAAQPAPDDKPDSDALQPEVIPASS